MIHRRSLLCIALLASLTGLARADERTDLAKGFAARRAVLEAKAGATAKEWYDLAVAADSLRLEAESKLALERTLEKDPDHAGARARLGYQRVGGAWVGYDEAQRRRGFVLYEGRWVTRDEKERLEQGYVREASGTWVKREVLEARRAEEEAKAQRIREHAKDEARLARERARERAAEAPGGGAVEVEAPPSGDALARMLAHQLGDARAAEQFLGVRFHDVEQGPLLVHTTHPLDAPELRDLLTTMGRIYEEEARFYDLPLDAPIWPGKLQVYFFKEKAEFDAFATRMDAAPAAVRSGGYFIHSRSASGEPKLHIAMFDLEPGKLAHEVSHAFMSRYQGSERVVAPWLNEGVAELLRWRVLERLEPGKSVPRYRGMVREMVERNDPRISLRGLAAKDEIAGSEVWAYAASTSAVDFMIHENPARFVSFLKLVKRPRGGFRDRVTGAPAEEQARAIEETFGTSLDRFEARWKDHIRAYP